VGFARTGADAHGAGAIPTPSADDLTSIDSDGTAHIKRSVPVPKTISPDACALMVSGKRWTPEPGTKQAADFDEELKATYPIEITESTLAGVACKIIDEMKGSYTSKP